MVVVLPRRACSSESQNDHLWTSTSVVVSTRQSNFMWMQEQCHLYWSPGMVLYISPGTVEPSVIADFAHRISVVGSRLGKARRITCGTPVSREVAKSLYQSFHCVEFVNTQGYTCIVDDGNEIVAPAVLVGK